MRYCTLQFGGALSRTPAPREGEFHGHLSHGIIGKRASSREWPLAHNAKTVHTNVGQGTRSLVRETRRDTGRKKNVMSEDETDYFCLSRMAMNHHEITDARRFAMRVPRDRRGRSEDITMSVDWLLGTVYTWQWWLFHERPKTSAGGDRGRCRLRRTERYAQFDRRYNTIENITAGLLPLSLSLDRPPRVSPPRFPARLPPFRFLFFPSPFFLTFTIRIGEVMAL